MADPKNARAKGGVAPTNPDDLFAELAEPQNVLSDKEGFAPAEDTTRSAAPVVDAAVAADLTEALAPTTPAPVVTVPKGESPEAAKIRSLEEQIKRAQSKTGIVPESDLTPEQKRIRDLEDQLARASAKRLDDDVEEFIPSTGGETLLLHFLETGFTALGRVWYRGQELEFEVGSQAYEDTKDRYGKTWLALLDDEYQQIQQFGKVMFRRGPWPGTPWTDDEALKAERTRNRMAPVLPAR